MDADRMLGESTVLSRRLSDKDGEGMAAVFRCRSMLSSGRFAEAAPYAERGYALLTEAGDRPGVAVALFFLALNAQFTGKLEAACGLHERCVALCRELGFDSVGARALQNIGITRLELGNLTAARTALQEGLPASVAIGDRFIIPVGLTAFAGLAARTGKYRMALRLAARRSPPGYLRVGNAGAAPEISGGLAGAGAHQGRRGGGEAHRRGAADDADGSPGVCAGQRARGSPAARPAADAHPPRDGSRRQGTPRPTRSPARPVIPAFSHAIGRP